MKKRDTFVILGILIIAIVGLIISNFPKTPDSETILRVSADGKIYKEIPLTPETNEEFTIETDLGINKVEIKDGIARVFEADCPDQVCVNSSPIQKVHDMIVCLPNQVIVEIISTN